MMIIWSRFVFHLIVPEPSSNKTDADYIDEHGNDSRVTQEKDLEKQVDHTLSSFDYDKDGYIEFFEFKLNKRGR